MYYGKRELFIGTSKPEGNREQMSSHVFLFNWCLSSCSINREPLRDGTGTGLARFPPGEREPSAAVESSFHRRRCPFITGDAESLVLTYSTPAL